MEAQPAVHPCQALFARELLRFAHFAQLRSTTTPPGAERAHPRYHRSWPLVICSLDGGVLQEYSASLNDASEGGVGFLCNRAFAVGSVVFLQLFWHDGSALRMPARVVHSDPHPEGHLTGTAFAIDDADLCDVALQLDPATVRGR